MSFDLTKAQTGRTTALLEKAFELSVEGYAVYFVCQDGPAMIHAEQMYDKLFPYKDVKIKFETKNSLRNFDTVHCRLDGAHPNCVVVVDHFVVEQEIHILEERIKTLKKVHNL